MKLNDIYKYLLTKGIDVTLVGDGEVDITALSTIQHGKKHSISFLHNPRYRRYLETTEVSAIVVHPKYSEHVKTSAIIYDNPHVAWAYVSQLFDNDYRQYKGVHPTAIVHETAILHEGVTIGPYSVIGANTEIGENSYIDSHCTIEHQVNIGKECYFFSNAIVRYDCLIGDRVVLHPNCVIGAEGFGFAKGPNGYIKVAQIGRVVLHDDVDVGAGSSIDRGAIEDTVIGKGSKIDNHVQLGHNCIVGEHTVIAGYTGIAGSTNIGNHVIIGGGVGINGHMSIEDNVIVTGGTMVSQPLKEGKVYSSIPPLMENRDWRYNTARLRRLDELFKRVRELEKAIKQEDK